MLYTVEGIVIRSIDYGEGNKIITLYTRELGKTALMVRGAKKPGSRHSAIAQLFTRGHYVYFQSRGQMGTLNSGEIIDSHHGLRENLQMTGYASYLAEMTDRILGEQDASDFLFEQLRAALTAIEEGKDARMIAHIFEMRMLEVAGYAPALSACVSCAAIYGEPSAEPWTVSVEMGGLLCPRCRQHDPRAIRTAPATIKLLRLFQRLDLRRLGKIEVKDSTREQLKQCIRSFFDTYVGGQWKSRHFLDHMEKFELP